MLEKTDEGRKGSSERSAIGERELRPMTEGMIGIFKEIITLFVIVGVGYAAKRLRFMNDEFDRMLSKLVINIALPGMILGSVLTGH